MALTQELSTQIGAACVGAFAFAAPVATASIAPVALPLIALAAMALHRKDGCAQKACEKSQKAVIKALEAHPEISTAHLTRVASLLNDAASPLSIKTETLLAAAKSGNFEAEIVQHLLSPLTLDIGESAVRQILETALHAGFAACRADNGFDQALQQALLIDAAHVANEQIRRLDEIKTQNEKTHAELEGLRAEVGSLSKALDHIRSLTKDQLEALATRFDIPRPYDLSIEQLRAELNARAEDYRTYRAEIEAIDERTKGLGNLKAAAQEAADRLDFEEVENLLSMVDATETEIAAQGKEIRARNALLRGKAEQAFTILEAAADSFGSLHPLAPSEKRNEYFLILHSHGLRYGGPALPYAITLLQTAVITLSKDSARELWASIKNNLAIALKNQANRTQGEGGADLLKQALTAYREALTVYTKNQYPVDWAGTQNNLAVALKNQANRTQGEGGADLLKQAVTAYREALTVYTKNQHPVDWASTQNNLANALGDQANRTQGEGGADLLKQAVTAFREALTVRTKSQHPVDWAATQNNLAIALGDQANRTQGEGGADLLKQAVTAFREALTVRTKNQHPVQWAGTQNNLAATLTTQANRTQGEGGTMLFSEAADAWQQSLTVRTKAEHPVQWAETKESLAILGVSRAQHDSCEDPRPHIEAALAYVEEALTVFDPVHMAPNHAKASGLREALLKALSADD